MMWRIVSRLTCSCSSSRQTVNRRSCCSAACTAAMLLSVRLVQRRLVCLSSCPSSRPSQKLPNHINVVARDTHSSPYAFRSNSYASVPVLLAFQQNLIALRCSIFVSMTIVVNTPRANCYNVMVTAPTLLFFSSFVRQPATFFQWYTTGHATRFATQKSVLKLSCHTVYVYVHIKRAHPVGMELWPWDNIIINMSQNKLQRGLSLQNKNLEIFEIPTWKVVFLRNARLKFQWEMFSEKRIFYVLFWFKMKSLDLFRRKLVQRRCLPKNARKCND